MSRVAVHYNQYVQREWERLERHRTEFAVTLRALHAHLPAPPTAVVDIGGGPGRYAIALTAQGYAVTLVDLAEENLTLAQQKAEAAGVTLAQALAANALDLSALPDNAFGAALLMGPLYHLLTLEERQQTVAESWRLLQPGGLIFAAFITRFAPFRDAAQGYPEWLVENWEYAQQIFETGIHDQGAGFPNAYFAHPDEIEPLMNSAGFEQLALIGCEGLVAGHEEKINALEGEAWERWVDFNYQLGQDPAAHGASDHLLYIGRKALATQGANP